MRGFENPQGALTDGIQATGGYPGRATNAAQLRAFSLIPGPKRLNLHAIYLESERPVERNAIEPRHFSHWVEWAKSQGLGLDFNPSCFSHPLSSDGFTLAHADPATGTAVFAMSRRVSSTETKTVNFCRSENRCTRQRKSSICTAGQGQRETGAGRKKCG
ncbi:hypothetical protein SMQE31_46820 (plasmid) [Serratia marcescens]|nr:hypothetical protein SMQE31_46820 [Serratia marcescens]